MCVPRLRWIGGQTTTPKSQSFLSCGSQGWSSGHQAWQPVPLLLCLFTAFPLFSPWFWHGVLWILSVLPLSYTLNPHAGTLSFFILCVWMFPLPECLCTTRVQCLQSPEGIRSPRTRVIDSCKPPCRCWGNWTPVLWKSNLLAANPFLQPLHDATLTLLPSSKSFLVSWEKSLTLVLVQVMGPLEEFVIQLNVFMNTYCVPALGNAARIQRWRTSEGHVLLLFIWCLEVHDFYIVVSLMGRQSL